MKINLKLFLKYFIWAVYDQKGYPSQRCDSLKKY